MAHLRTGRRASLAVPAVLSLTASLGFLPVAAAAPASAGTAATAPAAAGTPAKAVSAAAGPGLSYVVNTRTDPRTLASVRREIGRDGGTLVAGYDRIGVLVAHSADPDFARLLRAVPGVVSAGATRHTPLAAASTADLGAPQVLGGAQAAAAGAAATGDQDPLEPLQWDLPAIKADKAHQKTLGSPDVTVGVIDTGVDDTHPDIAPNFDRAASVDCVSGKPDTADGAWRPSASESPHGTHVAGEIAAARNGVGMTGVAPGVKVAGIKVANPDGYFYAESVVCGFVWAAEHHVDVTNNSYFTDPWYFNCTTDPDQRALVDAVDRASRYAEKRGTVNIAAAGNESYDLAADSITDPQSPNDGTASDRVIDPRRCFDIPTQLPGVVTVAATGAKGLKASYSNYGRGVIDIAAPGGDSTVYQPPAPPATSGLILGTLPGGKWGYMAGTSMATPHVAGVAALIKSTHPHASAALVKALLYLEADATPCTDPYDINGDGKADAVCRGPANHNGFYGRGMADALAAVTY
ncbi:S8 family serine peptidase [Streptomyces sp. WP-1]|uniref:S8 family peptidase n=1 Tax=Streptomyces sp. WP-1 TaxID=3041497 RepID=UPI002647DD1F|nr:S8 family serine peptidase [Streptomyces sp. WP-1]WKE72407.1 S8 family serine peptidase [Streptomyces sp. WP-1]